jgi:hypothetical protein
MTNHQNELREYLSVLGMKRVGAQEFKQSPGYPNIFAFY